MAAIWGQKTPINPIVDGSVRGGVRAEARGDGSAGGDTVPSFGAANVMTKKKKKKIHCGLRQPPINDNANNKQQKTLAGNVVFSDVVRSWF